MKPVDTRVQPLFSGTGRLWLVGIFVLVCVLPFVGLSFYNHPSLDDYLDAVTVRELGFWAAQKHFYITHTGRFTTTAFLALINPLIYTQLESSWWMVTLVFILGTVGILSISIKSLVKSSSREGWVGAALLLSLWLAYAPGQGEGLYWFTGAYTYILSAWLFLLWLAALGRYVTLRHAGTGARRWLAVLVLLTLAVSGTTEPIALPFLLTLVAGAGWSLWTRKFRVLWLLAGLAAAGSVVSFMAPGNFVRISSMDGQFGLVKALFYSAASSAYLLLNWVANPLLLALSGLLLPGLVRLAQRRDHLLLAYVARVPTWLLSLGLVALMVTASFPAYYASGTGLPLRARTTLYLFFVLGWFGVLLTWCCREVAKNHSFGLISGLANSRLAPLWTGLLVLFFFADYNVQTRATMLGQGRNNVLRAYQQWLGGEGAAYNAELRARYRTLRAGAPEVTIQTLQHRPDLLFSFDIVGINNPDALQQYARYFGAKKVVTEQAAP